MTSSVSAHSVLETTAPIDRAVFGDVWAQPDSEALRFELIGTALEGHLSGCREYANYAKRSGFSIESLNGPADLPSIPQIPTMAFKQGIPIASCAPEQIEIRCTSSGTRGRRSIVCRDRSTIERLLGSVRAGAEMLGDWDDDEVTVINLGPDQREAGDLWFAYVMSLIELLYPTEHRISGGRFDPLAAWRAVEQSLERDTATLLIGPPALVLEVAEAGRARRANAAPRADLHIVTAGGWKRHTGAVLDRAQFTDGIVDGLALAGPAQVRDAFNQVELNTVLLECSEQRKHVPPWLHVIVRDPWTFEPVGYGEPGLLSYLDPSASSYPCFIAADDFGVLDRVDCACGRSGRALTYLRRLSRPEEWGCALKMDRDYSRETTA